MAEVRLERISKVFDENVTAVSGFDLTVNDKEFVVLVGPSGCGKSTTLRMIAGLEDITSGNLIIDGKRINDIPPKDRDIAMVFQNYALYPHMDVYNNMAFGLKLRRFPKSEIDGRVQDAAQILGLTPYLYRKPKALSGGQRQRVAVGRAIVRKPKAFLFDEPLSNLDAKMRVQMRKEICQLHARLEATIIYVTHDQVEAMTMGDRIVVMNDGEIQQVGEPMEIYRKPANRFVAGFIGSPAMNFIDCEVGTDGLFCAGTRYELPDEKLWAVRNANCTKVALGVRPEDLVFTDTREGTNLFSGTVDINEPLGSEMLVYVSMDEKSSFIAKTHHTDTFKTGEPVAFSAQPESLHVFHGETGEVL